MQTEVFHKSVLVSEVLQYIRAERAGHFLDCTLGGGGHAFAILEANPANFVSGIDRDSRTVKRCRERFKDSERIEILHSDFFGLTKVLKGRSFGGMLADLGLSAFHLFEKRGFSFNDKSPLDMRMDSDQEMDADQVVNQSSPQELLRILKRGGTGRLARPVTGAILRARPIKDTAQLAEVVRAAASRFAGTRRSDPATVVFQAIRMQVNQELEQLEALLGVAPLLLKDQGRLVVISFHSLEDKAVTARMRYWQRGSDRSAAWAGDAQQEKPLGKLLTSKAVISSAEEIERNPSARSARLRAFEFLH